MPGLCQPDYEKLGLQQVLSAVEKMKIHLTYDEYEWWKKFIAHPETIGQNTTPWPLLHLQKLYKIQDIPAQVQVAAESGENASCLRPLLDVEEQTREVSNVTAYILIFWL